MNDEDLERLITAVVNAKEDAFHGDVRAATVDALEELKEARSKLQAVGMAIKGDLT